jgi:outer membrane murein-binding lipoprotein Lpp
MVYYQPSEEAEMNQFSPEVIKVAPGQRLRDDSIDQSGYAVIALLKEAASVSKENIDRAMTVAHKLSMELRAAEDRISQLEAEIEPLGSRAARAEQWLEVIKKEIEDKLIAPMEANRPELPVLH